MFDEAQVVVEAFDVEEDLAVADLGMVALDPDYLAQVGLP